MGRAIGGPLGFLKVDEMRRITAEAHGRIDGLLVCGPDARHELTGLSGGERQGLAIVRALHFQADIIILDEPTMGLSLKETEKALRFVEGSGPPGSRRLHRPQHLPRLLDR